MDYSKCFSKSQCFLLWQTLNKNWYLISSLLLNTYRINLNHQTMCTMHPWILCTWNPFLKWFMTSLLNYYKNSSCIIILNIPLGQNLHMSWQRSWAVMMCKFMNCFDKSFLYEQHEFSQGFDYDLINPLWNVSLILWAVVKFPNIHQHCTGWVPNRNRFWPAHMVWLSGVEWSLF